MTEKTKYEQALELITKTAEEWDAYAIYELIKQAKVPILTQCPNIDTYDGLLNRILNIYGIPKD